MATDNPNYYQEEQIDDRGIIPTKRWATEGKSPSVGLHIDNYDNLFNRNINVGKDVSQPDEELLKRVSVPEAINQGYTPEEAMGEVETTKERLSRALVNNLAIAGTTAVQGTVQNFGIMMSIELCLKLNRQYRKIIGIIIPKIIMICPFGNKWVLQCFGQI